MDAGSDKHAHGGKRREVIDMAYGTKNGAGKGNGRPGGGRRNKNTGGCSKGGPGYGKGGGRGNGTGRIK